MITWSQWKWLVSASAALLLAAGAASVVAQKTAPDNSPRSSPPPGFAGVGSTGGGAGVGSVAASITTDDRTTPLGTLRFMSKALARFDSTNVAACLYADGPAQQRFVDAMVAVVRAEGEMRHELTNAFGSSGAQILPDRALFAMSFGQESLDTAQVDVQGTNATVVFPDKGGNGSDQMRLVQIGKIWMLSGDKGGASPTANRAVSSMERMASAVTNFTEDLKRGAFTSANQAMGAMRRQVGSAMKAPAQ